MVAQVSVSKVCRNNGLSVKKVLDYLSENRIIPKPSQRKNKTFTIEYKGLKISSNGESIKVLERQLVDFLESRGVLKNLVFVDEETEMLDSIADTRLRTERISAIKHNRIAFIDAEYRDGNYYEFAFIVTENGRVVEKAYYILRDDFNRRRRKGFVDNRIEKLKEASIPFEIIERKHVNRKLKALFKSVDYIVAHNAYGDRQCLIKNGIYLDKKKFICTAKITEGVLPGYHRTNSPSLLELNGVLKLKRGTHFCHFAFEDARMTMDVFFKMLEKMENMHESN